MYKLFNLFGLQVKWLVSSYFQIRKIKSIKWCTDLMTWQSSVYKMYCLDMCIVIVLIQVILYCGYDIYSFRFYIMKYVKHVECYRLTKSSSIVIIFIMFNPKCVYPDRYIHNHLLRFGWTVFHFYFFFFFFSNPNWIPESIQTYSQQIPYQIANIISSTTICYLGSLVVAYKRHIFILRDTAEGYFNIKMYLNFDGRLFWVLCHT